MKAEDYKWYDAAKVLPENCEYDRTNTVINKDFIVYLSEDYDPCFAVRAYEKVGRGWYWEFGIWNYLGDNDCNEKLVTKWMPISRPD